MGAWESMAAADDEQKRLLYALNERVKKMASQVERVQIADYIQLMNRPWRLLITNLAAGIARGVGIAIGFTIFTSAILYFLQIIGAWNLPIIGDFIAQIVKHVQVRLDGY